MKTKAIVLCLILCLTLLGCAKEKSSMPAEEQEPYREVVETFLSRYQALDGTAGALVVGMDGELRFQGYQAILAERMEYIVGQADWSGETILVNVEIQNVDFAKAYDSVTEALGENADTDTLLSRLETELTKEKAPTRIFECQIPVLLEGDTYRVQITPELSNALSGGFAEYLSAALEGGE